MYPEAAILKFVLALAILVLLLCVYFFYQGNKSASTAPPSLSGNELAVCGSKPKCVSSMQDASDDHYIEAIELAAGAAEESAGSVVAAIESLGGKVTGNDGEIIQATFTSGIFKFVDDVQVRIGTDKLQVRSSSRVGHSDLGANRKRIERLRQALS